MRFLITTLLLTSLVSPAYALRALVIKSDRVLIDLEGEELSIGDKLGVRDSDGKPRAILEVKQVKDDKAVAAIIKGRMEKKFRIARYSPQKKAAPTKVSAKQRRPKRYETSWGFTAGYAMNSMSVKPTNASSISLSGNSFNLSAFYQMRLDGNISSRILGGYETLQATGNSTSCTGECKVDISYLGLEALVRYSFLKSKNYEAWAGAGLGFLFALSKSSNVLDTGKISTNQTLVGSLGLDYNLSNGGFIPVQLDYAVYPDNGTSSAKQTILRVGYGFDF